MSYIFFRIQLNISEVQYHFLKRRDCNELFRGEYEMLRTADVICEASEMSVEIFPNENHWLRLARSREEAREVQRE